MTDRAYDIVSALPILEKDPTYRKFCNLMRRFLSYASVSIDLNESKLYLYAILDIQDNTKLRENIAGSLMVSSIIAYTRALDDGGEGRFKVGIYGKYTKEEKELHTEIQDLRNTAIAHYGIGAGRLGSIWTSELAVMIEIGGVFGMRLVSMRNRVRSDLADQLERMIDRAKEIALIGQEKAADEAKVELLRLKTTSPEFWELLTSFTFDPATLNSSREFSENFWKAAPSRGQVVSSSRGSDPD